MKTIMLLGLVAILIIIVVLIFVFRQKKEEPLLTGVNLDDEKKMKSIAIANMTTMPEGMNPEKNHMRDLYTELVIP